MLDVARLVTHKTRPGSFGHVESLEPLTVVWVVGGREVWAQRKWGERVENVTEECRAEELEITDCPGCGEDTCWCGVGR